MNRTPPVRSNQEAIEILFPPESSRRELFRAGLAAVLIHLALLLVVLPGRAPEPRLRYVTVPRELLTIMSPTAPAPEPPPPPPARDRPVAPEPRIFPGPPRPTPTLEPIRAVEPAEPLDAGSGLSEFVAGASLLEGSPFGPPVPPPRPSQPVRFHEEALRILHMVKPEYPLLAKEARLEGKVILDVHIDEEGRVTDIEVLKGAPLRLTEAAVEAVKQWRYEPARVGGRAVPAVVAVHVTYILD